MATIADVARKAGVSVSTAWHVLNVTRRVAPDPDHPAKAAVESFADRLKILARSLKAASTKSITKAVSRRGLRAPKDLAIFGFDDFEWADCFAPRLTLVAQSSPEIDRRAAFLLGKRTAVRPSSGCTIDLDAAVVARDSRGRPP